MSGLHRLRLGNATPLASSLYHYSLSYHGIKGAFPLNLLDSFLQWADTGASLGTSQVRSSPSIQHVLKPL